MLIIQILVLIFVYNAVKFALKQNKENKVQEQKARDFEFQQRSRFAERYAERSMRKAERFEERQAREAERQAAFERQAQEQKTREEAKAREQKAREQELIRKFLSSDRSKKLGLSEQDVTIIYVTETKLLNTGYSKKITYPKVVRVELS